MSGNGLDPGGGGSPDKVVLSTLVLAGPVLAVLLIGLLLVLAH